MLLALEESECQLLPGRYWLAPDVSSASAAGSGKDDVFG
jgi:hypothetical protein